MKSIEIATQIITLYSFNLTVSVPNFLESFFKILVFQLFRPGLKQK